MECGKLYPKSQLDPDDQTCEACERKILDRIESLEREHGSRWWDSRSRPNPGKEDVLRAMTMAIFETVEESMPEGAPESPLYMAMEQHGISFNVTKMLVDGLIRAGYLVRKHDVLYTAGHLGRRNAGRGRRR